MLDDFPSTHGHIRDTKIIDCVHSGRAKYNFVRITSEYNGHKAEFQVFEDALKIDEVRINVTPIIQQQIADLLRCILPTAKLYDLMWHQCKNKILPKPRSITSTTQAMIEHSQEIDEELAELGFPKGLKSTVGKTWIIDNGFSKKPGKACNHGWHFTTGTKYKGIGGNANPSLLKNPDTGMYWYMIQARGWRHGTDHVDYSQVCVLVSRQCWVDGNEMDIHDVLSDPELAPLANHDGVLEYLRQPGVTELDPIVDLPVQPPPPPPPPPIFDLEEEFPTLPSSDFIYIQEPEPEPEPEPIIHAPEPSTIVTKESGSIWTLIMSVIRVIISILSGRKSE